ncbi:MAG: EFR1 family ferrodoxin [Clostridiales bacterium]|nr:EFR1 family ferrodoxin [Clostridiales bacterium]MCF8023698.1 EFR1 family ferrodoxin [Clostridiales bacterium]
MNKKLNLLYFSATDTTARVVKEVGKAISDEVKEYDITLPGTRQEKLVFGCNELVIVGVPVYAGRVPDFLIDYFEKVKGNNTPAIFIVVYGNRDYDDALLELKNYFEANGFIGIAGGVFIGEHSYTTKVATGRPDIDDLKTATKFGMKIKEKLNGIEDCTQTKKLIVKGNFPYKERKSMPQIAPETSDKCIKCGVCAEQCPMRAIDFNNFKDIDVTKCIKCCRCIKGCPVEAKSINNETLNKIIQALVDNLSTVRYEPELFI